MKSVINIFLYPSLKITHTSGTFVRNKIGMVNANNIFWILIRSLNHEQPTKAR